MRARRVTLVVLSAIAAACADRAPTGPTSTLAPSFDLSPNRPSIVISQVYGGGGNSGATLRNDFIELLNTGSVPVSLAGWSVQYASAAGSTWQVTALSGTIQPGAYYLVQEAQGTGGTTSLPTPDAVGTIAMSGTSGKVSLVQNATALTGTCPTVGLMDQVNYGSATDCGYKTTPALTNTTAAIRKNAGCTYTGDLSADFATGTPTPRNSASPTITCGVVVGPPVSVSVSPVTTTLLVGATQAFTATAYDANNNPVTGLTFAWSSDAPSVATVSTAGVVTALSAGDATITATTGSLAGTATVHVNAPAPLPAVRFSEIHYDNSGTDAFEAIEVEGPEGTDLTGWSIVLYNGNGGASYGTTPLGGAVPSMCSGRGVVAAFYPQDGIQNGSPDGFALVNAGGQVVEFLSYEGTFTATNGPASGSASVDIVAQEASATPVGQSLARNATGTWAGPAAATFGACNSGEGPPPPPLTAFTFTGRTTSDPALPVGFQDQLFVSVRDQNGNPVTTTITWSSDTPGIATIDQDGVFTAVAAGTAVLRASTAQGASGTFALPTIVATASATANYGGNTEFGTPTDANPTDDILIVRPQYTASFSPTRNTPNWVAYDLDASHIGSFDRCDCFTYDPTLPSALSRYTTAAYTGSGAYHNYGIDRGHLARSFDRTTGNLDNANTFYFSNIIPQAADLNQGPWAVMENDLGALATGQNREVYIIAGVAGSKGTLKDLGLITIPAQVWKVALVLPRDQGLANIHSYQDLQVIAVIMPNDPGVRNVDWHTYETTVDAVEALSGYDLLALLNDQVEIAVESNTAPPTAATDGPYASNEGSAVALGAAASSDPDGDALTYAWDFGDGSTASAVAVSHTWVQNGVYTVRLVVTDIRGLVDTAFTTATVANVAPSIGAFAGATLLPGETYATNGSFTDPGADTWRATVDYGDGSGVTSLPLTGMQFALSHTYAAAGAFTVTVRVADGDAVSSRTQNVTVLTPVQGTERAIALVAQLLADGTLERGEANSLTAKLDAAKRQLLRGNTIPAVQQLEAMTNELDAIVRSGRIETADAAPLRLLVMRVIRSLSA